MKRKACEKLMEKEEAGREALLLAPEHIAENSHIFDFSLSDSEMNEIANLNTGNRYESW